MIIVLSVTQRCRPTGRFDDIHTVKAVERERDLYKSLYIIIQSHDYDCIQVNGGETQLHNALNISQRPQKAGGTCIDAKHLQPQYETQGAVTENVYYSQWPNIGVLSLGSILWRNTQDLHMSLPVTPVDGVNHVSCEQWQTVLSPRVGWTLCLPTKNSSTIKLKKYIFFVIFKRGDVHILV